MLQLELEIRNEENRRLQAELEQIRTAYTDGFEQGPVGFLSVSKTSIVRNANQTAADMLGLAMADLVKMRFTQFVHKEDLARYTTFSKRVFATGDRQDCEIKITKADKTIRWFHLVGNPGQDKSRSAIGRIAMADITERKNTEYRLRKSETVYKSLYDSMTQGMGFCRIVTDDGGKPTDFVVIEINNSLAKLMDITREAVIGKRATDYLQELEPWIPAFGQVALTGEARNFDVFLERTGKHYSIYAYSPLHSHFAILISDISNRKKREELLKEYDIFFNICPDMLSISQTGGRFLKVNPAWERVLGYAPNEIEGKNYWQFFHPDDAASELQVRAEITGPENIGLIRKHVNRYVHKDGSFRYLEWNSQQEGDKYYAVARDITDRISYEKDIEYLSYHDALTGLYNRRFMEEEINRLDVARNLPISIIMGDINQLKLVNDAFGHEKGDEFIRKAANAIRENCRLEDLAARWGGDEFIVYLPMTQPYEAEAIVDRIMEHSAHEHVNAIEVSISFGIGTKKLVGEKISDAIRMAEDAMYLRKARDRSSARGDIIAAVNQSFYRYEPREEMHAKVVSVLCKQTAEVIGLNPDEVNKLTMSGLMHDIGKIAINAQILEKTAALTETEWKELRMHPEIGYRVVSSIQDMHEVGSAILAHHERWDGKGYPKGTKWGEIPLFARIITLADSYATMTSPSVYQPQMTREEAVEEIRRNEGSQFDPEIAEIFIKRVVLNQK